jgi:ABC-type amino acid transport system permease subunit
VSLIGVAELFSKAQSIGRRDFRVLEMLLLAGSIYWSLTVALSWRQAT